MDVPSSPNNESPATLITGGGDVAPQAPSNMPTQIGDEASLPDAPSLGLRTEPPVVTMSSPPPLAIPATETRGHDEDNDSKKKLLLIAAAALAAVLVLGLLGMLVFGGASPGQLTITTTPPKVQLFVDGKPVAGESPFVVSELEPGTHNFEVRANGYEQFVDAAELAEGEQKEVTIDLKPIVRLGGFTFNTSPTGARVYLDDELVGTTPVTKDDLEPGVYVLRAEHEGNFVPFERTVPIREGQERPLPTVTLQPDKVIVTFTSEPGGAGVTLIQGDVRKSLGSTPARAEIRMSAGPWSVEMKKRGFDLWTQPLTSIGGEEEFDVAAVLSKEGEAAAASDADERRAERERQAEERAREAAARKSAAAERQREAAARAAERRAQQKSTQKTESSSSRTNSSSTSAASGGEGVLAVNTVPWSQVYVDGRLIGNTPRPKIPLSTGRHTLTLVRNDLDIKKNVTVVIKKGETTKKIVKLLE